MKINELMQQWYEVITLVGEFGLSKTMGALW